MSLVPVYKRWPNRTTKYCPHCGFTKALANFFTRREGKPSPWCRDCHNELHRQIYERLKAEVYNHYGWLCACCGEAEVAFLTVDHVLNDGYKERPRKLGKSPAGAVARIYRKIIKENFPETYQILCWNCQWGKRKLGMCPHQRSK